MKKKRRKAPNLEIHYEPLRCGEERGREIAEAWLRFLWVLFSDQLSDIRQITAERDIEF